MDLRVAHGARLIFHGLVVVRPDRSSRSPIHIWRMAAQAQEVDIVDLEQPGIGRPMRRVA